MEVFLKQDETLVNALEPLLSGVLGEIERILLEHVDVVIGHETTNMTTHGTYGLLGTLPSTFC